MKRPFVLTALVGVAAAAVLASAPGTASAAPAAPANRTHLSGTTAVTTAPGIASTLLRAGVVPLPVLPDTGFRIGFGGGQLNVTYSFPITGGNPNLSGPSGDIFHSGGIYFVGRGKHLEIGKFDIDLAAGKVFAKQVNFAAGNVPILDLDLSGLQVSSGHGRTVLSGIIVRLDPAAAGVLNQTFGLGLPTDGSLVFGSAVVTLNT